MDIRIILIFLETKNIKNGTIDYIDNIFIIFLFALNLMVLSDIDIELTLFELSIYFKLFIVRLVFDDYLTYY
jgi:hypothetical protein